MSSSTAQPRATKRRDYRLGKRAEKQQETRQRIVEAAVDLHGSVGPARTSIAQIAERAGVQRHTVYAHFPDERSMLMACSALSLERDPLPDPEQWLEQTPGRQRVRQGLEDLYGWYERNADISGCVLRDAEHHQPTRETVELRMAPTFERSAEILGEDLDEDARALLAVALDFACWRKLRERLATAQAAALMAEAVTAIGSTR